jgi:hypothetical protein
VNSVLVTVPTERLRVVGSGPSRQTAVTYLWVNIYIFSESSDGGAISRNPFETVTRCKSVHLDINVFEVK